MAKKTDKEPDAGLLRQFDSLKQKHPDAMLLFREGDFYRLYKEDAAQVQDRSAIGCQVQTLIIYT